MKDPVGLHYYRFQEEEFAILQMLDGETSMDEVKDQFEAEFPPQKITLEELQQFLGQLHRSGLIIVGVQGQGTQLLKRRSERQRKEFLNAISNILCLRWKGIDPERIFAWTYPKVKWFFSPWTVAIAITMGIIALALVLVNFEAVRAKMPTFSQFFTPGNAFLLAITLAVTKVLHEFGHGLSCKHFGGECHELGFMLLVLTPCLYCNVSDSWMLPNKWHRAFIGAAGMYVELILASIATFVWFKTTPETLPNMLALNVMFICSVSTVVFNANPLLRYDGYYILADLTEIPNLRQKATTILSSTMAEWCLGLEPNEDPFLPQRNQAFFAVYSVAAAIYRWVVVISILFFLYKLGKSWGLEIFGQVMAVASISGLTVVPLYQVGKFFWVPGRMDKVKKPRLAASLAGLAAIVAFVVFVPLPYSVMATVEIQPQFPESVYVDPPGFLDEVMVKPGMHVEKGATLARLHNMELDAKLEDLQREVEEYESELESLNQQRDNPEIGAQIPALEAKLAGSRRLLKITADQHKRLRLVAPVAGTVLPPPWTPEKPYDPESPLPTWAGTPFEPYNLGAYLDDKEGSVLFCQIGDPKKLDAILVIDQADIQFVRPRRLDMDGTGKPELDANGKPKELDGDQVAIQLDELPEKRISGEIVEVSLSDLRVARRLSNRVGGELATKTDPTTGAERPLSTSYQARVPIEDPDGLLRLGLRGRARIYMDRAHWQTLWQRAWRLLAHTFSFKL